MRTAHATHSVARTGLSQPVATGLPSNGSSTSDAFASLVQALADLQGQSDGSSADSGDGSTGQDPQTQTSAAAPTVQPNQKTDPKTAAPTDSAVVLATVESEASMPTTETQNKDPAAPTDAQTQTVVDGTTVPDQAVLALLAAALPAAPVVQSAAPMPPAVTGSSDQVTAAKAAAAVAIASQPTNADATLASDAAAPTQNPVPAATPVAAVSSAPAPRADETAAPSTPPDAAAATDAAQIALAMPASLATLPGLSARSGTTGLQTAAAAKSQPTKPIVAPAPTENRGGTSIQAVAAAGEPTAPGPQAHGLGQPATTGLPAAPARQATEDAGNVGPSTSGPTPDDAGTVSAQTISAIDAPQIHPATPPAPHAAATDPAAPAFAASTGFQTVSAAQSVGAATQPDLQNMVLMSRNAALAASAVAQVNVVLQRAGLSRADSLTVQLDPAELGRVEVKLKMDKSGGPVHATVTADRPQTLDMLKNDKGALERALQSAGLSTNSGSLSFNLRGNGGSGQQALANGGRSPQADQTDDGSAGTLQLAAVAAPRGWTESGRLDLRV